MPYKVIPRYGLGADTGAQRLYLGNFFVGIFSKCTIKWRQVRPSSTNETQVLQGFCWDKRRLLAVATAMIAPHAET